MTTMKNLAVTVLMSILATATFTACSDDSLDYDVNNQKEAQKPNDNNGIQRTVLVYMAGRNNLSYYATTDLAEMKEGSMKIGDDQALLVFMRRNYDGEEPWLARIKNGEVVDKVTVSDMGISKDELFASDPEVMEQVMHYAFRHYPSVKDDYGLVLWGHAGGWLLQDSLTVDRTRGYGVDAGNFIYNPNGKWINMPTMNNVLKRMPHLKFIFADCCNFMCLESLYELRHTADYIIGSPAEIPVDGAPYETVVPAMFEPTTFYHTIMERYHEATKGFLPLSVVKTSEMENVAQATKLVMQQVGERERDGFPDMKGMVHYNYLNENDTTFHHPYNIFYDAGNFIQTYATPLEYKQWKQALDAAVIEKHIAYSWHTDKLWSIFYTDFEMTEEKYHGVSMFVPQDPNIEFGEKYLQMNQDITRLQWFSAVSE
ncbi:MAG: hypothetical protein J6W43_09740 [Prevotella sp.]|nr:hypothetical protein [Prevotella sp.]MBP5800172.1 hypothetical protein [Prevotella sp.]